MIELLEPVNVWVFFKGIHIHPYVFFWKKRKIKIETVNLIHTSKIEGALVYHFSVSAGGNFYRLRFSLKDLKWFLEVSVNSVETGEAKPPVVSHSKNQWKPVIKNVIARNDNDEAIPNNIIRDCHASSRLAMTENILLGIAQSIKERIHKEVGDFITCSIGISYNKMLAKLAGSCYKPDGLVAILDTEAAIRILDTVALDEICGIGGRIKNRLNNMGVFSFADLREIPLENLLASFKSYGLTLYNWARGVDHSKLRPFYEKEEVKFVGHRLTISHDINDPVEIKQVLLKLSELVARRLRAKKLVGRTVSLWYKQSFFPPYGEYRAAFNLQFYQETGHKFYGDGMQFTMQSTADGLEIFKTAWKVFLSIWDKEPIRMIGVSVSNLTPQTPENLSLLIEKQVQEKVTKALDKVNDRFGEFTLQRGILLGSTKIKRMPNPFLADRRFKL